MVQDQSASRIDVLCGLSPGLADGFLLCAHMLSLLIRTLIVSGQGPTIMTSLNLNYFLRDPISKYSYIEGYGFIM